MSLNSAFFKKKQLINSLRNSNIRNFDHMYPFPQFLLDPMPSSVSTKLCNLIFFKPIKFNLCCPWIWDLPPQEHG